MLGIESLTLDNISLAFGQLTAPGLYLVIEKGLSPKSADKCRRRDSNVIRR